MWLPDRLYELLPVIYGIAGLLSAFHFDTFLGHAAGFLLLLIACLVGMMRRECRVSKEPDENGSLSRSRERLDEP